MAEACRDRVRSGKDTSVVAIDKLLPALEALSLVAGVVVAPELF